MNKVDLASGIAFEAHKHQMYGDKPYRVHLIQVAMKVSEMVFRENIGAYSLSFADLRSVAYLHDILEDTDYEFTKSDRDVLGEDVMSAVFAITRKKGQDQASYLDVVKSNSLAYAVKVADTMCNYEASVAIFDKRRIKKYALQLADLLG